MDGRRERAGSRARVLLLSTTVVGFVVVDQLSKWWAWRHVARVTVDIGGGVFDEFVGGLANSIMQDPLAGAVADLALAALLVVGGHRFIARERSWPVLLAGSALLAASVSNLLDRLGLHSLTAPGSARGVVNWISFGGDSVSPVNLADLVTTVAVFALGAIWLTRLARERIPSRRLRAVAACAAVLTVCISIGGVSHARSGVVQAHRPVTHPRAIRTADPAAVAARRRQDLGAPPESPNADAWPDNIRQIELDGSTVTVIWASERVSVVARLVLGWRVDGVSALYLHAVVVGPTSLEVYLPPPRPGAGVCLWQPIRRSGRGRPPVWECNAGTPLLRLRPAPVLFS